MQRGFQLLFVVTTVICSVITTKSQKRALCIGIDERTCINTSKDLTAYSGLRSRCSKVITNVTPQMKKKYADQLIRGASFYQDVECIYYRKTYTSGGEEIYTTCMEKEKADGFCPNLLTNETIYGYKLKVCVKCGRVASDISTGARPTTRNLLYAITVVLVYLALL